MDTHLPPDKFKEVTGFNSPEEMIAWEEGYAAGQDSLMKYIEKWNGQTNSAIGALLSKKFKQLHPPNGTNK